MKEKAEYSVNGERFRMEAERRDFSWGHGIAARIVDAQGELWGEIIFSCHPEFSGFDACQLLTTEQLLQAAVARLQDETHKSVGRAYRDGLTICLPLHGPVRDLIRAK